MGKPALQSLLKRLWEAIGESAAEGSGLTHFLDGSFVFYFLAFLTTSFSFWIQTISCNTMGDVPEPGTRS